MWEINRNSGHDLQSWKGKAEDVGSLIQKEIQQKTKQTIHN
jgi:hypothetical protein